MADQKKQEKKDITSIASVEVMLEKYIDNNITSIFEKNTKELENNKKKEYVELSKKYLSIPSNPTSTAQMMGHHTQTERIIKEKGVWQNKGFDWIVEKTIEDLSNPKNISKGQDLGSIVSLLQENIINNIGKKKYDELCKKYKVDIAEAKFKMILSERMEAYMIKRKMPKSDIEYVLKNILNETFIGASIHAAAPQKNDKDLEIDDKALKQYDASLLAKGTSTVLSYAIDGVTFGQSGIVKPIVTGIGWELGASGVAKTVEWGVNQFKGKSKVLTPKESYDLNKDIYGANVSKSDIDTAKKSAESVKIQKLANLGLNGNLGLNNKIKFKYSPSEATAISKRYQQENNPAEILKILKQSGIKVSTRDVAQHIKDKDMKENYRLACYFMGQLTEMKMSGAKTIKIGDTTLTEKQVAQRAHDYAYYANEQLEMAKKMERAKELEEQSKNEISEFVTDPDGEVRMVTYSRDSKRGQELAAAENSQSMVQEQMQNGFGGWSSLLGWGGGALPETAKNFSEFVTALPDMIVGMFTGKNKHLKLSECFFPLAAIMGGLLFKNPLIRILLLIAGGMMLFQKAKQNMGLEEGQSVSRTYKKIPDEPLNSRIKDPVMKGNTLVASIDDRPYVITVSDQAVDAYYKGYIPINALSNKVLEVFDRQEGELQSAYSQNVANTEEQQRTRGIK